MIITAGSTDVSCLVYVVQDAGGTNPGEPATGLTFSNVADIAYVRAGSSVDTSMTPATISGGATGAHTDGGFIELDSTNMPGLYRLDIEDNVCAITDPLEPEVVVQLTFTGASNAVAEPLAIDLISPDIRDASALIPSDLQAVDGTAASATTLDNLLQGTTTNLCQAGGTSTTLILAASETYADDTLNGQIVAIIAGTAAGQARLITDYDNATDTCTVTPAWADFGSNPPDATSRYVILNNGMTDVAQWLNTAVTATTAGRPDVNVQAISDDATAADNLESACDNYSVTRGLSGTALPAAAADAAGGLPISDAGGLDLDAMNTLVTNIEDDTTNIQSRIPAALVAGMMNSNVAAVSGDTGAADNLELDYDGTGYNKSNSTIGTTTTNTDMRGTDSAALASVCTEPRLAELDAANIPADIDTLIAGGVGGGGADVVDHEIRKGTTSKILRIYIEDTSSGSGLTGLVFNSAGLAANYTREGDAAETVITLATMTEGTYASGGFVEMDATDLPGWYEFCPPDAALATGADSVIFDLQGATNMAPVRLYVKLTDIAPSPIYLNLGLIKQSTNVHVLIGPVIGINSGSPLTSLTLANITAARTTATGSTVTRTALTLAASGDNQFTHVGDGYWEFDIRVSDSATAGYVSYTFRDDDVFHPIVATGLVVPANIWDSIVGGTDTLDTSVIQWLGTAVTAATAGRPDVNVLAINDDTDDAADLGAAVNNTDNLVNVNITQISDDAAAADNLEAAFDGTGYKPGGAGIIEVDVTGVNGTQQVANALQFLNEASFNTGGTVFQVTNASFTPTTTQFEVTNGDATDDHYNGGFVVWTSSVGLKGARYEITDYDGANQRFTVSTMVAAPANGDAFMIV